MKRARIEYELDGDTRVATFEAEGIGSAPDFPPVPVLMVQVEDAEDADGLVALIEKHDRSAPKKRKPRTTKPPAAAGAVPATSSGPAARGQEAPKPDDPPCTAHADGRHVRTGGASCACEPANPDELTPPADGAKRAHRIVKQIDGETKTDTGSAPGPRAA